MKRNADDSADGNEIEISDSSTNIKKEISFRKLRDGSYIVTFSEENRDGDSWGIFG